MQVHPEMGLTVKNRHCAAAVHDAQNEVGGEPCWYCESVLANGSGPGRRLSDGRHVQKIEIFGCYGISSAFGGAGRPEDEEILRLKLTVAADLGATTCKAVASVKS